MSTAVLKKPPRIDAERWGKLGIAQKTVVTSFKVGTVFETAEVASLLGVTSSRATTILRTLLEYNLVDKVRHGQYRLVK